MRPCCLAILEIFWTNRAFCVCCISVRQYVGMIGAVEHGHFFLDSAWFRSSCGLLKVAAGLLCASWTYLLIGWSQRVWKFKCLSSSHMLSTAGTTPEVRVPQSHHISPLTDIAGDGEGPHLKTGKCHFSPSRELLCVMCWLQTSSIIILMDLL